MIVGYDNGREQTTRLRVEFTIAEARALIALLSESEGWRGDEIAALERVAMAWAIERDGLGVAGE